MDELQKTLDKLFENPKTMYGLRNKIRYIQELIRQTPYRSKYFRLFRNELESTHYLIRNAFHNERRKEKL